MLVDAEVDLAALDVADSLGDVGGHRSGLRVRHQVAGAQHLAQATHLAHHVRGGHGGIEVGPTVGDLGDQLVAAHEVGAGLLCLGHVVTLGEDDHAGGLTGSVRQVHGATHHLIGLAGVDREAQGDLDGGVGLGGVDLLGQGHGLGRRVDSVLGDLLECRLVCFAALCHLRCSP